MNNFIFKSLLANKGCLLKGNVIFLSTSTNLRQIPRPVLRKKVPAVQKIEPYGWFMLIIPAASFGLGVWQIQRKSWKENLIAELNERTSSAPIELPKNLDELKNLEFHPIRVRGTFQHDKEIYLGPRSLLEKEELSSIISMRSNQGYLVVTPFKLADRDETILVNRGWVSGNHTKPERRREGQIEGIVDVIGLVRLHENRPNFAIKNKENSNLYFYRDLDSMCAATGASPVFLDQTVDFNVKGGPIGGQTRVALRNEHFAYIITWFSLSAATSYMWYKKFVSKVH